MLGHGSLKIKGSIIMSKIIDGSLSSKVLMVGNYYKHHHPGGISAVVQYWSENIEDSALDF